MLTYRYNPAKEVAELYDEDTREFIGGNGPTDAEIDATWAMWMRVLAFLFFMAFGLTWVEELVAILKS